MAQRVDPRSYMPEPMVGDMPVRGDMRVTPRLPLHATPGSAGSFPGTFPSNGAARPPSGRKRRAVGTGPGQRPRSIDYTQAQVHRGHSPPANSPSSFVNRVQGYTGNDSVVRPQERVDVEAAGPSTSETRRRRTHQPGYIDAYDPRNLPPLTSPRGPEPAPASYPDLPSVRVPARPSSSERSPPPLTATQPPPAAPHSRSMKRHPQEPYMVRDESPIDKPAVDPNLSQGNQEGRLARYGEETELQNRTFTDKDDREINQQPPQRSKTMHASPRVPEPWEWATDKSPLQKLEGRLNTISKTKEEKRARVERAEQRLRERRRSEQVGEITKDRATTRRTSGGRYSVPKDTRPPAQVYLDTYANIDEQNPSYSSAAPPSKTREGVRGGLETVIDPEVPGLDLEASRRPIVGADGNDLDQSQPGSKPGRGDSRRISIQGYGDGQDRNMSKSSAKPANRPFEDSDQSVRQTKRKQQEQLDTQPLSVAKESSDYHGSNDRPPKQDTNRQNRQHPNRLPPQKAVAIEARRQVGFNNVSQDTAEVPHFPKGQRSFTLQQISNEPTVKGQSLEEWRRAGIARLTAADLAPSAEISKEHRAWWEKEDSSATGGTSEQPKRGATAFDGSYESIINESTTFDPPLYLKCGPLLRYTGLKRDQPGTSSTRGIPAKRETWRGSVMIVTVDAKSQYRPAPTLRLFAEPMQLLSPAPQVQKSSEESFPAEYADPVAGLPKLSKTGRMVYVKPVEDLQPEMDLSRLEGDEGLFEQSRTAVVPTSYGRPDPRTSGDPALRMGDLLPAQAKRYQSQEVEGIRLHAERGLTFWRFNLEIELGEKQARVAYRINNSPSVGFWVPAREQVMNIMYYTCNGFSLSVKPSTFSGPDPMWRDVLNNHQTRPFHVMIGGGDQIYNDAAMDESPMLRAWLELKTQHGRQETPFLPDLQEELERFYLERYSMWFSQGLFGMANSQIPMINIWNDRDIIDGFGSYPDHFMATPVFCGLGAVAYKYYMLFQHQSVPAETSADEPSWVLGAAPGPYINELSRSVFMSLGHHVAFLGLDGRTERMQEEVLSGPSYDRIFDRCRREIEQDETKHLIVSLGVPIAYPRLVWLENILTSRALDPIKALARRGMMGGFLNKIDGGVEVLDDLDNQWTAHNHKEERNWLVQELQELAAEKSVRITILGGNAQLAAIGQFYSNPKLGIRKDRDHRYMPNVVSSAIVNAPPPDLMADVLNKRNKVHRLDLETDEDMIPMFTHDVDGKIRNNKRLLTRRNWCSIREYQPGSTPPPSRSPSPSEDYSGPEELHRPAGRLQRTLSLTREDVKPGNLIRRLSQRGPPPTSMKYPMPNNAYPPSPPDSESNPSPNDGHASFQARQRMASEHIDTGGLQRHSSAPLQRPGNFQRRPTNLSIRAAKKGGAEDDEDDHINLEHGLDIVLNCEISPKDPAGLTVPYRLLVPALWYEVAGDINDAPLRRKSFISRIGSIKIPGRSKSMLARNQGQGNWGRNESFSDRSFTPPPNRQAKPFQPRPQNVQRSVMQPDGAHLTPHNQRDVDEAPPRAPNFTKSVRKPPPTVDVPPVVPPDRQPVQHSPPPVGVRMMELRGQDQLNQYYDDPSVRESGYPGRRPSKLDRVLGIGSHRQAQKFGDDDHVDEVDGAHDDYSDDGHGEADFRPVPPVRRPSKLERVLSLGRRRRPKQYADYDSGDDMSRSYDSYGEEEGEPHLENGRPLSMGYSGIDAYTEKEKGWKRWFS